MTLPRHTTGGLRISHVIILAAVLGAVSFVDWNSIKDKLPSLTEESAKVALTSLDCEVKSPERTPRGVRSGYALVDGSVENIGEAPLRLSVRIDYVWKGRKFQGKRIESVDPAPLAPKGTGSFSFKEEIAGFPEGTGCLVQFYENNTEEPIPIDDRTS